MTSASTEQQQQQIPKKSIIMKQVVTLLASIGVLVVMLAVTNKTTMNMNPSSNSVRNSNMNSAKNHHRLLSNLNPPDFDHAKFFEYLEGTYDFLLQYDEDGALHATVEIDPATLKEGDTSVYFVDCNIESDYVATCNDYESFNFTLDIYMEEVPEDVTDYQLPNILYTRPDGNIYSVFDSDVHLKTLFENNAAVANDNPSSEADFEAEMENQLEEVQRQHVIILISCMVGLLVLMMGLMALSYRCGRRANYQEQVSLRERHGDEFRINKGTSS
jgi:hypothetical protein